jgi:hypothetical protein
LSGHFEVFFSFIFLETKVEVALSLSDNFLERVEKKLAQRLSRRFDHVRRRITAGSVGQGRR